jgi:hypothetical protein
MHDVFYNMFSKSTNACSRSAPVLGRSNCRRTRAHAITESLQLADMAVAEDGHTPYFENTLRDDCMTELEKRSSFAPHGVAQAFQPAGSGDFLVAQSGTGKFRHQQTRMSALQKVPGVSGCNVGF